MSTQVNIEHYKNQLLFGVVNGRHSIKFGNLSSDEIESTEQTIRLYEELQESLFPIIRLTSIDVYEHTDNFPQKGEANQYFKNLFPIDGEEYNKIIKGAEKYFSQNIIRSNELDWLYMDAAIYAIYRYTKHSGDNEILKKYEPLFYKVLAKDSDYLLMQAILVFAWKILKWILWIAAIVILFFVEEPQLAFLMIAIKALLTFRKLRGTKTENNILLKKLSLISKAYSNLSEIDFNKSLLLNDLFQCRNADVDIPNSLFGIIESLEKSPR